MQAIRIDDHVYNVRRDGPWDAGSDAGPVCAFSNSLGTDLRVWDPLMPYLPASWRVFRYDTAGHGLSDFAGAMPLDDHADDLRALLDACGVESCVVVGLSVGGLIGQALVKARPEMVSALVLCDTASIIGTDQVWNDRIAAVRQGGMEAIADAVMERWFSQSFITERPVDLALWRSMLVRTNADAYCALSESIRDADYRADAPNITAPTMCVVGKEDGATPPDVVRATARQIPGARFHVIDAVGHLPCVEAPEALAGLLIPFVEEALS